MKNNCSDCAYNINDYGIMFDDVLGYEDCIFQKEDGVDE